MLRSIRCAAALLALSAALAACADRTPTHPASTAPAASLAGKQSPISVLDAAAGGVQAIMSRANQRLAAVGAGVRLDRAELSLAGNPSAQTVVYAKDRELRLDTRWVPFDPRRGGTAALRHANFLPLMNANAGVTPGAAAVNAAYATWNGVTCNNLATNLVTLPANVFPSLLLGMNGFVADPFQADINIIGWLPAGIFAYFFGSDAPYILGVTWTFIWVDGAGNPTDIDHDRHADTALKEMWFNEYSPWSLTGVGGYDIQTIALHEEGHTLELGHFGKVFVSTSGKLQESPRAVMNAFYLGVLRAPLGSDVAALCGDFGSWPN